MATNEIIKVENIDMIVQDAPKAYAKNQISRDRCIEYGKTLLAKIQASGMTDELDQQASAYINKARLTIKKMQDNRSPLTKLFDEIRSQYTSFENEIDPTKLNTIPYQLQVLRNQYAARKREEEERKRREEMLRIQRDNAKAQYRRDIENVYTQNANTSMCNASNALANLFSAVTLDTYDKYFDAIKKYKYAEQRLQFSVCSVTKPTIVPIEELNDIQRDVEAKVCPSLVEKMEEYLEQTRQQYLDLMPAKKMELERAAKASEEEAEIIRQQIALRDAEEAARKGKELLEQQELESKAAEMQAKANQMGDLFDGAAAGVQTYSPKTSVKKKISILDTNAIPTIIAFWWEREGCKMSTEELAKMFKKQITFCEKAAKDGEYIMSEHIVYEDEVKAK